MRRCRLSYDLFVTETGVSQHNITRPKRSPVQQLHTQPTDRATRKRTLDLMVNRLLDAVTALYNREMLATTAKYVYMGCSQSMQILHAGEEARGNGREQIVAKIPERQRQHTRRGDNEHDVPGNYWPQVHTGLVGMMHISQPL